VSLVRKRGPFDTALLYARADDDPVQHLDGPGYVARRLLELGETEDATRLLREGQAYAAGLPTPNKTNRRVNGVHARGRFASKLARIDTKGALELAAGFDHPYKDWYLGACPRGRRNATRRKGSASRVECRTRTCANGVCCGWPAASPSASRRGPVPC
jgi:hypothetical protein